MNPLPDITGSFRGLPACKVGTIRVSPETPAVRAQGDPVEVALPDVLIIGSVTMTGWMAPPLIQIFPGPQNGTLSGNTVVADGMS